MKPANPRWLALQILLRVLDQGRSLDQIFGDDWLRSQFAEARDLAFCRELASGLCRWYFVLQSLLRERLQKPLRARDRDIEIALLLGLYQLLILRTDAHAAVNESVELAVRLQKAWARGLINALLRGVIRDGLSVTDLDSSNACPAWMQAQLQRDWGTQAETIVRASLERPPMILRVDTHRHSRQGVIQGMRAAGIEASEHASIESAIVLEVPSEVSALPGFAEGVVSVQDAGAQIAASLLDCAPGDRVLDACAAPGGKTLHLLQAYPGIELDALDISATRLERVEQNLTRGQHTARLLCGDATAVANWHDGVAYAAILADVPCSASGVMRRHPDIKVLRRESDIMPLVELQQQIMRRLWGLLKPGGRMLYCTCSIFRDENERQIAHFLQMNTDASTVELPSVSWGEARSHGRQILPQSSEMDGFYYALLAKTVAR